MARVRTVVFRVLGALVTVVLGLGLWLLAGVWPGRVHAMRFGRIEVGGTVQAMEGVMGRGPDCRYSIASYEVRYYLSPGHAPSSVTGCSSLGTRLSRWGQLPKETYEAIIVSISAQGRVEAKQLTGESSLYTLPDSRLPEGAAAILCCVDSTASPQ